MQDKHQNSRWNLRDTLRKAFSKRNVLVIVACLVVSTATFGGTMAYILTNTTEMVNEFTPAEVSCLVSEDFSGGIEKKNVCVLNTGDAAAYIRVKLLPYWYDKEDDSIIAKSAWVPAFTPGSGWELGGDGFYYYTSPVKPGESTSMLISSLNLKQDDVSLARQVLEIIATCIQAEPAGAVMEAWSGTNGSVTGVSNNTLTVAGG